MQEISVKILKQRIVESQIYVSRELEDNLEINMECKVNLKTPKNEDEKSVLLNVQLDISAKEKLKIELDADVVFELEKLLDNYDQIAEKQLIPMACESLLNSLDDMLVVMGYNKMGLGNEIRKEK